jgi:hypothetical protein
MPALMYRLADVRTTEVRYSLRDRVAALLDNWPEARHLPSAPNAPTVISLQELMAAYSQA